VREPLLWTACASATSAQSRELQTEIFPARGASGLVATGISGLFVGDESKGPEIRGNLQSKRMAKKSRQLRPQGPLSPFHRVCVKNFVDDGE
jgi:hypothetical protein